MTNFVTTVKWVLLVTTLTSRVNADDTHGIEKRNTNGEPKKIVCYYTNWSVYRPGTAKFTPQNINPYLCTHLIYAFGGLDKENGLQPFDKYQDIELGGYAKFTGLKTYNKNLKTMLAIGGWNEGSTRFSKLVADEDRRAAFVKNVIRFLRQYNFDGLDLDWEYPAFRDGSHPEDRENYASLVKELREEFDKESSKTGKQRLLLTMAVPAGIEYIDKGYDVPKLNRYLDFFNILSYDYHSAYEPNANHHAPLYSQQEESEYNFDAQLTIDHTIKHYLKQGADPEKLVLGIPTYGRSYTLFNPESTDIGSPADGPGQQGEATREKGYLAYYEICGNVEKDEWKIVQPKKGSLGPYAFHENQWVGYDDVDIVREKAKFVNEKGLGGIMYWSIDNDDFRGKCHGKPYPLIEAGKEALLSRNSGSSNIVPSSTEEKRTKLGLRKNRPKQINTTHKPASTTTKSTTSTTFNPLSTPEPPTTPDPGSDFVCKEEGFFPHPRDCKKYFWCLDSGPSNLGIVAHQFTCPSGLLFNKISDSCDYSRNVICNKKSEKGSTTTTTTVKSSTASATKIGSTTTTSTTTTTTETIPEEEYVDAQEDADSQEDPKAIKQLISLIKKLGGISELEKQLKLEDNSHEVTTPAISKTLYNKVFSGPTNNRFKNQHRNGPSGPQNEGLSPSADVPYRKDKPQYVTIQRSRPLKNIPQDTEDSGTSNNKSIEPSRDDDTADYADHSELEEKISTPRYSPSSPRSRSTTGESKSTSLKYVVLERTRPDRTTTEEEELIQETPSSSTHRYITLLRHRQSTTTTEPEEQNASTTEIIDRSTSKPSSRSDKEESTYADRFREKVSELEGPTTTTTTTTTTSAPTLPVTSVEYNTVMIQHLSNDISSPTTNKPNTFLVFPQTAIDSTSIKNESPTTLKENEDSQQTSTEPYTTSIATTIISTVRESATEITRIPLRTYREYIKKQNRTEINRNDLRQNVLEAAKRRKNSRYTTTQEPKPDIEVTSTRRSFTPRKRINVSPSSLIEATKSAAPIEQTMSHSRLFFRRHRNGTTTTTAEPTDIDSNPTKDDSLPKQDNHSQHIVPNYRQGKFQPKHSTTTRSPNDEHTDISSLFRYHRRQSTTTERLPDSTSSISSSLPGKSTIRHFLRNRKTFFGEQTTTEQEPKSTHASRSRFANSRGYGRKTTSHESTSESNESNRFTRDPYESPTTIQIPLNTDQVPQSNSNEQITGKTSTTITPMIQTLTAPATISVSPVYLPQHAKVKTEYYEATNVPNTDSNNEEAKLPTMNELFIQEPSSSTVLPKQNLVESAQRLRIHPRNNSRFLKSHETFENRRDSFAHSYHLPTFRHDSSPATFQLDSTPINLIQGINESKIEFDIQIKHENDIHNTQKMKSKVLDQKSPSFNRAGLQLSRGRQRFWDQTTHEPKPAPAYSQADKFARNRSLVTNSKITTVTFRPTEESIKNSDNTFNNQRRSRVHLYSSPSNIEESATTARLPPTRNRGSIKARNSLSKTEIKEIVNLVEEPASKTDYQRSHKHSRPINKIEETSFMGYDNTAANTIQSPFTGRGHLAERSFLATNDFDVEKLNSIIDNQEQDHDKSTHLVDYFYEPYGLMTEIPLAAGLNKDFFRVSETNNRNDENYDDRQHRKLDAAEGRTSKKETNEDSAEPSTRLRGNFRRNNPSMYTRTRPTTSTSTTAVPVSEYSSSESHKLASRFRRRKVRPENRSINTARSENFIPLSEIESSTVTRHKNNDGGPNHGPSHVSDYLPVPAPLYRFNQTVDQLQANNINSDEIEPQTSPAPIGYQNDDISDLAHPAVAAISNLKTLSPASSPQPFVVKTEPPFTQQIIFNKEVPAASVDELRIIKSTPRAITAPVFRQRISRPKGSYKIFAKVTSTTQQPSLQDIYNDYQDPESEFHADPVDIPISGKVRIHSDGYIECLDMGNFPHPFSCKKFISCAKMEYESLLGWEYTCPKGLSFDPIGGICNWAAGLGCKE